MIINANTAALVTVGLEQHGDVDSRSSVLHNYSAICLHHTREDVIFTSAADPCFAVVEAEDSEEEEEAELGGLFRVNRPQKSKKVQANALDCSHFNPDVSHDWELEEVRYFSTELRLKSS